MITLSVLDQSHIGEGKTAADALNETTRMAQEADKLGYTRYWLSEHHAMKALAHSSPEVLIAHIAAQTRRIRVGSGGVMLPHYSTYKVAENFRLLEALHPGRIDLGLGRAPGGMPMATRALQEGKYVEIDRYPQQIAELTAYLNDTLPAEHPYGGLQASPNIPTAPEIWLLGSSHESARLAGIQGKPYAFAQFFGTSAGEEAMDIYRGNFRASIYHEEPKSAVAVLAICADTDEEANQLATSTDLFFLRLERGLELLSLPSVATALDYPYTSFDYELINRSRRRRFVGSPATVKAGMEELARVYGTEELIVVSPIHDFNARVHSYKLLAEAFGLQGME